MIKLKNDKNNFNKQKIIYEENEIDEYKKAASVRKPILLCVCRGVYSEGANLKNEQSRIIALIGIPYLPISSFDLLKQKLPSKWDDI